MAGRQRRDLFRVPIVKVTAEDQDCTNPLLRKSCEGRFEIGVGSSINHNEFQAQRERRRLQASNNRWGAWKYRVRKNAEQGSTGDQLADQLQSFRRQFAR